MSHIKNKGIFYVEKGTDPNILGITPASNLGLCKTQDGTKEWNYNDTLAPGSKWVLKDGGKKVYKALLFQNGTADPVANILENTLGGEEVVWLRESPGLYLATHSSFSNVSTNPLTNKVVSKSYELFESAPGRATPYFEDVAGYGDNTLVFINKNELDGLWHQLIEIEVYP